MMNNFAAYQGRPLPMELFPGCFFREHDILADRRPQRSCFREYILYFLAGIITVGICFGAIYYNPPLGHFIQQHVLPKDNKYVFVEDQDTTLIDIRQYNDLKELAKSRDTCIRTLDTFREEIIMLKKQIATISNWRTNVNGQLTNMQWQQDAKINSAIEEALDIFEADGLGEMDYAATYAGGKILEISKDTYPMPSYRTALLRLFQVQINSNPEEIIRTCVLPGCCFAFSGTTAAIKIRLGKPIAIDAVTLSHGSNRLLREEGMSMAPKDFEVYGYETEDDDTGTFLGKFIYSLEGRQHQTFRIKKKYSKSQTFYAVELAISSNHGKPDFTCVYRFRVHQREVIELPERGSRVTPKKKKCC